MSNVRRLRVDSIRQCRIVEAGCNFIETRLFSRLVVEYLDDESYARLQWLLAYRPEAGALVRGSGGVRKIRWSQTARGKRGSVRVIYHARVQDGVIWMLTIYAKNEAQSIPAHTLRRIREEIDA